MREHTENRPATALEAKTDNCAPAAAARSSRDCVVCSCGGRISLTPRLMDVLGLVAQGLANKAIAQRLHLAESTTRSYVSKLLAVFRVNNRTRLALEVARRGLFSHSGGVPDVIVTPDSRTVLRRPQHA